MQIALTLSLAVVATTPMDVFEWLVRLPETIFHGYSSLIRWAADSVHELFDRYGYWVVFLGTLSENTLLIGLIIPGSIVVLLAGLAAHDGTLSFPLALALGALGTMIGDTISYWLGRLGWTRFGERFAGLAEFRERVREPILRRGVLFVLVYHFAGYTRVVGPAGAGMLKMPFRKWAPADYTGAVLWVSTYMAVGYALGIAGLSLDSTNDLFRFLEYGLLVFVMIWGYYLLRAGQRTLAAHLEADSRDDDSTEPVGAAEAPGNDPQRGE